MLNDTWFSDISHGKRHTTPNMLRTDYAGDLLNVPDPVLDGDDKSLRPVLELAIFVTSRWEWSVECSYPKCK